MTFKTSESIPPQSQLAVQYWERSLDPYHPDAYKAIFPSSLVDYVLNKVMDVLFGDYSTKRRSGWMGFDYYENPIIFIADDVEYDGEPSEYILKVGPYKHVCAYNPDDLDRMARHAEWIRAKEE